MRSLATKARALTRRLQLFLHGLGQDLQSKPLDITGIRWKVRASEPAGSTQVNVQVRSLDQWRSIGSFDAAVVNQALRYAADRRVVATTITPGDGRVIRRVTYLHPVLTDTPLGCRIVEADRFIDTFSAVSRGQGSSPEMVQLAADRQQMYRWMRAVEIAETIATIPPTEKCPHGEIEKLLADNGAGAIGLSPALTEAMDAFIAKEETGLSGSTSLIRRVNRCTSTSSESGKLAACFCQRIKGSGLPSAYWYPEDHTSQFREKKANLRPDWQWMGRSRDRLAHIDLWVHTTFALRKQRTSRQGVEVDEASAVALDFPAGHLDALRRVVAASLPGYLSESLRSPSYEAFMAPVEDFVLLQRLFRSALAGGMGRDFPIAQLVQLERDTRKFVPFQPTIRWESVRSEQILVNTLKGVGPAALSAYDTWRKDLVDRTIAKKPLCDRVSN